MSSVLDDAYDRLHATGPEWGGNLTNHGPMAAEVMVRRGYGDGVDGWVYVRTEDPEALAASIHASKLIKQAR